MTTIETYKEIEIKLGEITLKGNLRLAENSKGIVIFSHGSGSSRLSIRNNYVANLLFNKGFSSLLFDLLTEEEDKIYENRFDIELLTERLIKVSKWVNTYEETKFLSIGYFGASTGAASALSAAAKLNKIIKAVVSRGGRPDLSLNVLDDVKAPVLFLVGAKDATVIELNRKVQAKLKGVCELKIIEGASHLFEEPGKLEIVTNYTEQWFDKYL